MSRLNRMTDSDREGFQGANDLPSGPPLMGEAILPDPAGGPAGAGGQSNNAVVVVVVACGDDSDFVVQVVATDGQTLMWAFPTCERDAVAFAEMIVGGHISWNALAAACPSN